jgi:hypothetical protein
MTLAARLAGVENWLLGCPFDAGVRLGVSLSLSLALGPALMGLALLL